MTREGAGGEWEMRCGARGREEEGAGREWMIAGWEGRKAEE